MNDMLKTQRKRKEDTYRSSCTVVGRCLVQLAEETKIISLLILYIPCLYEAEIEVTFVLRANHVRCFDNSGCPTASGSRKENKYVFKDPHAIDADTNVQLELPSHVQRGRGVETDGNTFTLLTKAKKRSSFGFLFMLGTPKAVVGGGDCMLVAKDRYGCVHCDLTMLFISKNNQFTR